METQVLQTVGMALLASLAYSLTFYVKKTEKIEPETFNSTKFISTMIVGAFVGVSMELSGATLAFTSFEAELAAMAGTIAVVESVLKAIYRKVDQRSQ